MQGRIRTGQRFVERGLAERDRIACKRFLDGSESAAYLLYDDDNWDGVGILPEAQEVGNVNYLAINIQTKVASVAIGDPDFYVNCGEADADAAEIVKRFLRDLWKARFWARVCRKALLKRSISGMGIVAYLWHDELGPVIEHVRAKDLAIDPNVVDWHHPKWGARRIRMARADAEARYPKHQEYFQGPSHDIPNLDEPAPMSRDNLELWCYWDTTTEAVMYGQTVLETGPNLYGCVPLLFLEGDIAPESEFSLGDYDSATQLQDMLARLQSQINNQAENGGAIGWYNPALLDDSSKDAFTQGRPQEFVAVTAGAEETFGFISGEQMAQSLMEAFRIAQQGLDSVTGVTEFQRGVLNQNVKFATEAALMANQSGARGNQARIEYEQFLDSVARAVVDMVVRFGPSMMVEQDPNDLGLMNALLSVQDICVLESSTAYKDPASEMQSSLQLLQAMMPFVQAGLVNALPLLTDVFRAFGKRDVQKYLVTQGAQNGPSAQTAPPGPPAPGGPPPGQPPPGPAPALPPPSMNPAAPDGNGPVAIGANA